MICPKCKANIPNRARFCTKCGEKIEFLSPEFIAKIEILKNKINAEPLNPRLHMELGEIYLLNNSFNEALIEYSKSLYIDDSNPEANFKAGIVYLKLKNFGKAESLFLKALSINPELQDARLKLFGIYTMKDELDKAIPIGEEIIEKDPLNLEVHRELKEIYEKKGLKEKVIQELESIHLLAPRDKDILKELAKSYKENNEKEKSIDIYQRVLELDPNDIDAQFAIGESSYIRGDYQKTIEYIKNIYQKLPQEDKVLAQCYLAISYINSGRPNKALEFCNLLSLATVERVIPDKKPILAKFYFDLGCESFKYNKLTDGIEFLERATKYEPQKVEYQKKFEEAMEAKGREEFELKRKTIAKVVISATVIFLVILTIASGWYFSHSKIYLKFSPPETLENAKIYVDGDPSLSEKKVFLGSHKITVWRDGYEKWERIVKTKIGNKTIPIEAKLVPIYGSLKVDSKPSGAYVYLDGKQLGKTPLLKNNILAIGHELKIKREGYKEYREFVFILRNGLKDLDIINLKPYEDDTTAYSKIIAVLPYEYEGDIEMVIHDRMKFEEFVKKYPKSNYVPEALYYIVFRYYYPLQFEIEEDLAKKCITGVERTYITLLQQFPSSEWTKKAKFYFENIQQYMSKFPQIRLLPTETGIWKVKVVKDKAEIRTEPAISSSVAAKVPVGAILESLGKAGEWYQVSFKYRGQFTISGYIHQSFVEIIVMTPKNQDTFLPFQR